MSALKQTISQTTNEIKMFLFPIYTYIKSLIILFSANFSSWYSDYFSDLINILTKVGSLLVIFILIRYHHLNTKKLELELKEKSKKGKS